MEITERLSAKLWQILMEEEKFWRNKGGVLIACVARGTYPVIVTPKSSALGAVVVTIWRFITVVLGQQ